MRPGSGVWTSSWSWWRPGFLTGWAGLGIVAVTWLVARRFRVVGGWAYVAGLALLVATAGLTWGPLKEQSWAVYWAQALGDGRDRRRQRRAPCSCARSWNSRSAWVAGGSRRIIQRTFLNLRIGLSK